MTKSKSPKKAPTAKAAPAEEATVELLVTKDGIEKIEPETPDTRPTVAEWMAAEDAAQAQSAPDAAETPEPAGKKTRGLSVVPDAAPVAPTEPKEDLVVFAMRVTQEERDAIHAAAGPGKASRFVRQVAIAAARGDVDAVQRLIDARVK